MAQNELVTASTPPAATQPLAVGHTSLMHGWVPLAVQVVTAVVLVLAAGWRSRHWQRRWLPTAAAIGATLAWGTRWYVTGNGLANERPPSTLWIWVALTGAAATVLILGWRDIPPEARVLNDEARTMMIRTHEPMEVLRALSDRTDVLLEGGPTLAGAFLRAGAINRILAYVAPILLGGPVTAVDDVGVSNITNALRWQFDSVEKVGPDLLLSLVAR